MLEPEQTFFYGYARVALLYGLRLIGIGRGDSALVPDYIGEEALFPFRYLNIDTVYYNVDETLTPDIDSINYLLRLNNKNRALLFVNYFGFPNAKIEELSALCKRRGIYLIEDNAHGFLSRKGDKPLGSFGDISICSFRKTISVPNGAFLMVNNQELRGRKLPKDIKMNSSFYQTAIFLMKYLIKCALKMVGMRDPAFYIKHRIMGVDFYRDFPGAGALYKDEMSRSLVEFSRLSAFLLKRFDRQKEISRRRTGYMKWLGYLKEIRSDAIPIFSHLEDGVAPFAVPLRVEGDIDRFIRDMLSKGIRCVRWPGKAPPGLEDRPVFKRNAIILLSQ